MLCPLCELLLVVFLFVTQPCGRALAQEQLLDFRDQQFSFVLLSVPGADSELPSFQIKVKTPPSSFFSTLSLSAPTRLVLDLSGISLTHPKALLLDNHPLIQGVRLGTHLDKVRLVVDFKSPEVPPFSATREGDYVVIDFMPLERSGAFQSPEPPVQVTAAPLVAAVPVREEIDRAAGEKTGVAQLPPVQVAAPAIVPAESAGEGLDRAAEEKSRPALLPVPERVAAAAVAQDQPRLLEARRLQEESKPSAAAETLAKPSRLSDLSIPAGAVSATAMLKISVDRVFVPFEEGSRPIQDVLVKNKSDKPLYISSSVQKLLFAGLSTQKLEPSDDLLASPRRFKLPAGEQRTVRLVLRRFAKEKEEVYRIIFIPQAESFEKRLVDVNIGGEVSQMDIIAALAVTASSIPARAEDNLQWQRHGDLLVITNQGNASVLLDAGKFCPASSQTCVSLPVKRLFPANSWTLKLPVAGGVEFLRKTSSDYEPFVIPAERLNPH